jgi:ABC-type lipoprotein release transport system permease subunit
MKMRSTLRNLEHALRQLRKSLDFAAVGFVAVILLAAALFASWIPAPRGAGVESMRALRAE